ncbi:hypothetical protein BDFB_004077, partial [Asbolus verrucosus]
MSLKSIHSKDAEWFQCGHCLFKAKLKSHLKNDILKHIKPREARYANSKDNTKSLPFTPHTEERRFVRVCDVVTNFKILLHHHTNVVHKELEVNCDLRHMLRSYECGECDFQTCSTVVLLKHFCDTAHGSLELRAKSSEQWFQ